MDHRPLMDLHKEVWNGLLDRLDRLPHALLIHGAPGLGKLELAERFAQLLLCEKRGKSRAPCGACEGCRWFLSDDHPDVRYLEPEASARRTRRNPELSRRRTTRRHRRRTPGGSP